MEKFRDLLERCLKNHKTLGTGIMTLMTAGGESLFSNMVFQCPCSTWNLCYSLTFFLAPVLVFIPLSCLLSSRTGQAVTGCCAQSACSKTCCKNDQEACSRKKRCCKMLCCSQITIVTAVVPLTWIAAGLLQGNYYVCAASGYVWLFCQEQKPNCTKEVLQMPCQKTHSEQDQQFKAQSQMLGWILIIFIVMLIVIVKFYNYWTSPVSYHYLKFLKIYKRKEKETLKTESKNYATKLAERNVQCFFGNIQQDDVRIPSDDEWEEISAVYEINATYCSSLHKFINERQLNQAAPQDPDSN